MNLKPATRSAYERRLPHVYVADEQAVVTELGEPLCAGGFVALHGFDAENIEAAKQLIFQMICGANA